MVDRGGQGYCHSNKIKSFTSRGTPSINYLTAAMDEANCLLSAEELIRQNRSLEIKIRAAIEKNAELADKCREVGMNTTSLPSYLSIHIHRNSPTSHHVP
jgi:hypothetical protein